MTLTARQRLRRRRTWGSAALLVIVVNAVGVSAEGPVTSGPGVNGIPVTWIVPRPNPIVALPPRWADTGPNVQDINWPGPPDLVVNQAGRDDGGGSTGLGLGLPPAIKASRSPGVETRLLPNVAAATGGTPGPAGSPAIAAAVARSSGVYGKGEAVSFTVTVSNPTSASIAVTKVEDLVPAGYVQAQAADLWMDGAACNGTTVPTCTLDPATRAFEVGTFTLAASAQHVFSLAMVANPTFLDCKTLQNTATATDAAGTSSAWVSPSICDGGLGITPWWSMWSQPTGPQGSVYALAANGSLVVQQQDSTSIPLHGQLSLSIRRTFNSLDTGDGEPASLLGRGWISTFDRVGSGSTQDPYALSIPASPAATAAGAESPAAPYPITMIDTSGNRQVFSMTTLPTPIDVTALAGTTGPLATLVPRVLTRDTGFGRLCVDAVATSPAGLHLDMWRYLEVPSTTSCSPTGGTPAVLGWGAETPSRVRYEFNWSGAKLDVQDPFANEVRYQYSGSLAAAGAIGTLTRVYEPASGRALTFATSAGQVTITDIVAASPAANRVTTYTLDGSQNLTRVANPAAPNPANGGALVYAYGGCAGLTTQICSATDPAGSTSSWTYTTLDSANATMLGQPHMATFRDRRAQSTAFSYVTASALPTRVSATLANERQVYDQIDQTTGSVANVYQLDVAASTTRHQTLLVWDTASSSCRQPDTAIDHNLCRTFRMTFNGQPTAADTSYTYGPSGETLIERRCLSASDSGTPPPCPVSTSSNITSTDTTSGFHSQYVEASGTVNQFDDTVAGAGTVTSTSQDPVAHTRGDAQTVFYLYDHTQSLTPRGNTPGFATPLTYVTTRLVDDSATTSPNRPLAASTCSTPASPASNSGALCELDTPSFDGGTHPRTPSTYTYNADGSVATSASPDAIIANGGSGGTSYPSVITGDHAYTYFRLDDAAGAAPVDTAANSTAATLGGVTTGVAGATADHDTAMSFNGTTGGIKATYKTTPNSSITSFSAEAWGNLQTNTDSTGYESLVSNRPTTSTGAFWELELSDDGTTVIFKVAGSDGVSHGLNATVANLVGRWHHYVVTYDGVTMRTYVDGAQVATRAVAVTGTTQNAVCIGAQLKLCGQTGTSSGSFTKGVLDEVATYNAVLTPAQINNHYTAASAAAPAPPATTYTYYQDSDRDLSGSTSAGGWLKAVTDPLAHATVSAYDAAGHVVRTWDRDATQSLAVSAFPGSISSPPATAYTETLYSTGSGTSPYAQPWRYPLSQRDQLNDLTTYAVDGIGDRTGVRPPRGNIGGTGTVCAPAATYDVCSTFDAAGNVLTQQMPVEASAGKATQYGYDPYGNQVSTKTPEGRWTTTTYDAANRATSGQFTRGPWASNAPAGCRQSASGDAPIPSGLILCSTSVTYDGVDDVLSKTNAGGNATTFSYDGLGRQISQLVPRGDASFVTVRTDTVYDLDSNVLSVCRPRAFAPAPDGSASSCLSAAALPYRTDRAYDVAGRLQSQTTYRGTTAQATSYTHDADGNVTAVQDPNGHPRTMVFDLLDRQTSVRTQRDATTFVTSSATYDPVGNTITATAGSGHVTAYVYDAAGRRTDAVQGWDGVAAPVNSVITSGGGGNVHSRVAYDADGHVTQLFDPRTFNGGPEQPNTFTTTRRYDADGRQTGQLVPRYDNGTYSDLSVGSNSQTTQCPTGIAGYPSIVGVCTTTMVYNGDNQVVTMTLPTSTNVSAARKLTYAYTDDGMVSSVTKPGPSGSGSSTVSVSYLYDANGRLVQTTDELGRTTLQTYTKDGLTASVEAPPNGGQRHLTQYTYNADGQQVTVIAPAAERSTKTYTTDGLAASSADNAGDTTTYQYDAVGNTTAVSSPAATARVAPNPSGTPTTLDYTYDNLLLRQTTPVSGDGTTQVRRVTYGYADYGAKTSQETSLVTNGTAASAGTQQFSYYPSGRLQQETGRAGETIGHQYDAAGNETSASGGGSTVSSTYYLDSRVRSVADTTPVAGAGSATTQYGYDGGGSLASRSEILQTGGQYTTTYGYDDAGNPTSMGANWIAGGWTWSYAADGRPTSMGDPSTNVSRFTWNSDATLLTRTLNAGGGPNIMAEWDYTYDPDYRQTNRQFHGSDIRGFTPGFASNYTYDAAGRLQTYQYNNFWTGAWAPTRSATWDRNGNRTSWGDGTPANSVSASYNADNSTASITTNNNTAYNVTYTSAGAMANDGCLWYSYDGFERMTGLGSAGGPNCGQPNSASFGYDALNRRATVNDGPYNSPTAVHFDGRSSGVAAEQQQWASSANIIYATTSKGEVLADTFNPSSFNHTELVSHDGYSMATIATSTVGSVSCDAYSDPFGSPLFPSGSNPCQTGALNNTVQYRLAQRDAVSGVYQMGARAYDPSKASFAQPDAYRTEGSNLGLALSPSTQNGYGYVNGDPVNFVDPSGHVGECNHGPDCQVLQATPASDGGSGSLASQSVASSLPGYSGAPWQQAYGSASTPPPPQSSVAPLPATTPPENSPAKKGEPFCIRLNCFESSPICAPLDDFAGRIFNEQGCLNWNLNMRQSADSQATSTVTYCSSGGAGVMGFGIVVPIVAVCNQAGAGKSPAHQGADSGSGDDTGLPPGFGNAIKDALKDKSGSGTHGGAQGAGQPPPNLSPPGSARGGAFAKAKRDAGIPVTQQPSNVEYVRPPYGSPGTRMYTYETPNGEVIIRDDAAGHVYFDDASQNRGPHFNTSGGRHYDYQ
ncbi:MAG TPA: LamG-like jellyroll fold domain-containing protein [Candidatus Dormibacteraeota bacterium]|jgi:RHS repeat-associated protein|nr:LamG-like jellyroll fold domain-containing protein [Candidatus Dormibacteraeota bacterium]